jgi:hypothetical protein
VDYAISKLLGLASIVSLPGLCLIPLLHFPRKPLRALPLFALLLTFQIANFQGMGSMFAPVGNVVSDQGFSMAFGTMSPIWGEWVWTVLSIVGIASFSLYVTTCLEWTLDWLRAQRRDGRSGDPALILYMMCAVLAAITFILPPVTFDRYLLPILPALMVPALRRMDDGRQPTLKRREGTDDGRRMTVVRWLLLIPLALFSVVGMRDHMEHSALRWQAAESLVASGARYNQVDAGFEWLGHYMYRDGVEYIRRTGDTTEIVFPVYAVLDAVYVVSDLPRDGYAQVGALPYHSWLEGGQTRNVLLLKRK